jgi:hypothetical protein
MLPRKRNRDQGADLLGQSADLDLSLLPDFERDRGCGSSSRRRAAEKGRLETVPSPGTLRKGRANTFAGLGTSVSCPATS